MEAPNKIQPSGVNDYLEVMSKSVFQSGMAWQVVESEWHGTREAFRGFDAQAIADFTPPDLEELVVDKRGIRNRRKLDAIVENARRMLDLEKQHGSFRFLGESGAYICLWVVDQEVPSYEEWCASHGTTPRHD